MKLKQFLLTAFVGQVLLMLFAGLFGIYTLASVLDRYERDVRLSFRSERAVNTLASDYAVQMQQWKVTLLKAKSQESLDKYRDLFEVTQKRVYANAEILASESTGEVKKSLEEFIASHRALSDLYMKALWDFSASGFDNAVADAALGDQDKEPEQHLKSAIKHQLTEEERVSEVANASASFALWASIAVMFCFGLAGAIAAGFIAKKIEGRLGGDPVDVVEIAKAVASGDLTSEVVPKRGDETSIIAHMALMQKNLSSLVSKVRNSVDEVLSEGTNISSANEALARGALAQAASVSKTEESVHDLSEKVDSNAASAENARQLVVKATDLATVGGDVVNDVVSTMRDISASSKRIADIIAVIDSIAFQTNILALNAAVESARAGEHGRGFAVVSGEVRTLATRTSSAAREIKELIQASLQTIETGAVLADRAGGSVRSMVGAIKEANQAIQQIASSSAGQITALNVIEAAIADVGLTANENTNVVRSVLRSTESLRAKADELTEVVAAFQLKEQSPNVHSKPMLISQ